MDYKKALSITFSIVFIAIVSLHYLGFNIIPEQIKKNPPKRHRVAILGDSFIAPPSKIPFFIKKQIDSFCEGRYIQVEVFSEGTSGLRIEQLENKILINEEYKGYDCYLFAIGINSIDRPKTIINSVLKIRDSLPETATVIFASLPPFKGYPSWSPQYQSNWEEVNNFFQHVDGLNNIDVFMLTFLLESYQSPELVNLYDSGDGLHLSIYGQEKYAQEAFDSLYHDFLFEKSLH